MPRKTVDVKYVVEKVNQLLAAEDEILPIVGKLPGVDNEEPLSPAQAYRYAMAMLLEAVLFETDTYAGFSCIGVDFTTDPPTMPEDMTRRVYGTHRVLTNG